MDLNVGDKVKVIDKFDRNYRLVGEVSFRYDKTRDKPEHNIYMVKVKFDIGEVPYAVNNPSLK